MQKNVVIKLRLETATGRNILAGILKGIRDKDNCAINIASDDNGFGKADSRARIDASASPGRSTHRTGDKVHRRERDEGNQPQLRGDFNVVKARLC